MVQSCGSRDVDFQIRQAGCGTSASQGGNVSSRPEAEVRGAAEETFAIPIQRLSQAVRWDEGSGVRRATKCIGQDHPRDCQFATPVPADLGERVVRIGDATMVKNVGARHRHGSWSREVP